MTETKVAGSDTGAGLRANLARGVLYGKEKRLHSIKPHKRMKHNYLLYENLFHIEYQTAPVEGTGFF